MHLYLALFSYFSLCVGKGDLYYFFPYLFSPPCIPSSSALSTYVEVCGVFSSGILKLWVFFVTISLTIQWRLFDLGDLGNGRWDGG